MKGRTLRGYALAALHALGRATICKTREFVRSIRSVALLKPLRRVLDGNRGRSAQRLGQRGQVRRQFPSELPRIRWH